MNMKIRGLSFNKMIIFNCGFSQNLRISAMAKLKELVITELFSNKKIDDIFNMIDQVNGF